MKSIIKEMIKDFNNYKTSILVFVTILLVAHCTVGTICPAVIFLGIPCPACGMTRALVYFLQGKFKESFVMHPFLIFIIIGVILFIIIKYFLKKSVQIVKTYGIIVLLLAVGYYIYRMVVYFPNVEPMVYRQNNLIHNLSIIVRMIKGL